VLGENGFGSPGRLSELRFEQKLPTGIRGNPPNLDVVLFTSEMPLAIECKFAEPTGAIRPTRR
jgi:hypothetical protein